MKKLGWRRETTLLHALPRECNKRKEGEESLLGNELGGVNAG